MERISKGHYILQTAATSGIGFRDISLLITATTYNADESKSKGLLALQNGHPVRIEPLPGVSYYRIPFLLRNNSENTNEATDGDNHTRVTVLLIG